MSRILSGAGVRLVAGLLAAVAAGVGNARADVVVADNYQDGYQSSGFFIGVGYTDNASFVNEAAAQRFVAQQGGVLTTITATVDRFDAGAVPLTVGLYAAAGSVPGALLGSIAVDPADVSPPIQTGELGSTFDFSALGISLVAGQSYVVAFTTTDPLFQSVRYRALLLAANPNSFGIEPLFSRNAGASWQGEGVPNEIGLLVRATAVPEPGSLALLGLGLAGTLAVARSRRLRAA